MKLKFLVLLLSVLVVLQSSHAQNSKYMIDGVDTTPLVEALNAQVVTLKKPIKVYHWFNADPNSKWAEQYSANDPRGFEFVKFASQKYWNEYGNPSRDRYGAGLYAALDPIASQDFGGPNWVLVQIEFPVGSRLFDVSPSIIPQLPSAVFNVLAEIGCVNINPNVDAFLSMSTNASEKWRAGSDKCKANLRTIIDSYVQMDAFMYHYPSTPFNICDNSSRSVAWIVTKSSRLKPANVQIFNSQTIDVQRERSSLQSLFYVAEKDLMSSPEKLITSDKAFHYLNREVQKIYPGYMVTNIDGNSRTMNICEMYPTSATRDCKLLPIEALKASYPSQFLSNEVPLTINEAFRGLLWKDLNGKPTDPKIDEWIANNLYGCGK